MHLAGRVVARTFKAMQICKSEISNKINEVRGHKFGSGANGGETPPCERFCESEAQVDNTHTRATLPGGK